MFVAETAAPAVTRKQTPKFQRNRTACANTVGLVVVPSRGSRKARLIQATLPCQRPGIRGTAAVPIWLRACVHGGSNERSISAAVWPFDLARSVAAVVWIGRSWSKVFVWGARSQVDVGIRRPVRLCRDSVEGHKESRARFGCLRPWCAVYSKLEFMWHRRFL